jgi:endonuclease-3 related protein
MSRQVPSLRLIYRRLFSALGPQDWWPAKNPFEMMTGAILTQATNWRNVEAAIERLKQDGSLHPRSLLAMRRGRLERAIRPAGYFRQKATRLKGFSRWYVTRYGGFARRMFRVPWRILRQELLALHGIGPETADSMLLYAGGKPVFVVDAYTSRVFRRHRLIGADATYEEVQQLAMRRFPASAKVYNEFHALLVAVGKRFCHRRNPDCQRCPLGDLPHTVR